jgi:hypothetical protein
MDDLVFHILFGQEIRVKIIRFFLLHEGSGFNLKYLRKFLKIKNSRLLKKELKNLKHIGFLRTKGQKIFLNPFFPLNEALTNLVIGPSFWCKGKMIKLFQRVGVIKLLVLTGVLAGDDKMREVDMLIVGNKIKERRLANLMAELEADFGKELNYLVLTEKEFQYRYSMFDRLIRDVMESQKEVLIDKLGIERII